MSAPEGFAAMLAVPVKDKSQIEFPCLISRKMDGVRGHVFGGQALSRRLKVFPNRNVQAIFGSHELDGLDGEFSDGPINVPKCCAATTGCLDSLDHDASHVRLNVFDDYFAAGGFWERAAATKKRAKDLKKLGFPINFVEQVLVRSVEELNAYEEKWLDEGYEGGIVRSLKGPYKCGRSTVREGYMLKVKQFLDTEGEVIGFKELNHNTNDLERDALGHAKRSSKKAGKVAGGMLGALLLRGLDGTPFQGIEFEVGGGFTDEDRRDIWQHQEEHLGDICKFKYFPKGIKDRPRHATFLSFRSKLD